MLALVPPRKRKRRTGQKRRKGARSSRHPVAVRPTTLTTVICKYSIRYLRKPWTGYCHYWKLNVYKPIESDKAWLGWNDR
jgi:hypothetical protein